MRRTPRRLAGVTALLAALLAVAPTPAQAGPEPLGGLGCPPNCVSLFEPTCGETNPDCVVDARLGQPATDPLTLVAYTEDGTALAGRDYLPLDGVRVVLEPGQLDATFHVRLLPRAQGQFTVHVVPSDPRIAPAAGTVTIGAGPRG
jgi:hypothetical protein